MYKTRYIVPLIVLIGWIAGIFLYAANMPPSPTLPDTAEFPRVPSNPITQALTRMLGLSSESDLITYHGDGTVENTKMLSGKTADQFLQIDPGKNVCPWNDEVWVAIVNGKPKCAPRPIRLAKVIGTGSVVNGGVTIYRIDGTHGTLAANDAIHEGDIIQTANDWTLTIQFTDTSLIRLGTNATVTIETGNAPATGKTYAYAVLQAGDLWWRVLSDANSEYIIGDGSIAAWVQGTSVAVQTTGRSATVTKINGKWQVTTTGTPTTKLAIIHSQKSADVAEITCDGDPIWAASTGTLYTKNGACPTSGVQKTLEELYTIPWYAKNTLADLHYLTGITISGTKWNQIKKEYTVTAPTRATEKTELCGDMKTYWESLLKISDNPCQSSGLIAYANYTDGTDGHLYTKDGKIEGVSLNGANKPSGSYNLAGLLTGNWSIEITAKMPSETSWTYILASDQDDSKKVVYMLRHIYVGTTDIWEVNPGSSKTITLTNATFGTPKVLYIGKLKNSTPGTDPWRWEINSVKITH